MSLVDYLNKTRMPSATAAIAATDAATPSPGVAPHPRAPAKAEEAGLILVCHDRRAWGFPWSYYIESRLVPAGVAGANARAVSAGAPDGAAPAAHDALTVVFASREVVLRGRNLAPLHEAVVRRRVWEIRETPEKLLPVTPGLADGAPLVVEITVSGRGK